jgi:hypothetical protein
MITGVFIMMFLATVMGWLGWRWLAGTLMVLCIALYVGEFLWEIWSPTTGFSMPWLQGDLAVAHPAGEA